MSASTDLSASTAPPRLPNILERLPILILLPHNRCNCRCVMCDIWKITEAESVSAAELEGHAVDIESLGVEWAVFSGGEPLMHEDLFALARILKRRAVRTTILTTGLLLAKHAASITESIDDGIPSIDDVILSLDGPPEIHDAIRRVPGGFAEIERGVQALRRRHPSYPIAGRCTVQSANFRHLRRTVLTAQQLGLDSISFLAADVTSTAFHRPDGWPLARQAEVALSGGDIEIFHGEVEDLIQACAKEIETGYVRESPDKLRRLVHHFEAQLGQREIAAPRCNAPWVSAVVETDGTLRPCFFHPPIGNVRRQGLRGALNSPEAAAFRAGLDVASDPICRHCTCSLRWSPNS
jgi:Fe-coproporphyrin III synthase